MSKFNLISIDLAKNVFQVGKFFHQKLQSNKAVSRKELVFDHLAEFQRILLRLGETSSGKYRA